MNTSHRLALAGGFVVLAGLASVLAAPDLPDRLVTHWNAAGEPNGTMSKSLGLAFVPALSGALVVLLALVPRIDPLGENVATFRPAYDWFVVAFAGFMFVLHVGILAFNLGYAFDFTLLVLGAVAVLFYAVGELLTHAEPNWFVGIRTPWTLSNETVWDRTHELGSRLFKLTAVVSLIGLFFGEYAVYFLVVPALLTAVITAAYSYYCYRQLEGGPGSSSDAGV
ncbi:SdpI family protein [Natrinema marinum]|uniref:SdpI family protein n=1 Tax=Natrinema marinum TaxID=2961598 RepID=UPI0020C8838B|nr:SdpI family protein [Natrinema marinum]